MDLMNRVFGLAIWQIVIILIVLVFLGMTIWQLLLVLAIVTMKYRWNKNSTAKLADEGNQKSVVATSPVITA